MPTRGFFVTGTDTDVGKTVIACALVELARRRGIRLVPFKPAESGATETSGDARSLWEAAGRPGPLERAALYRFAQPVAPAVAAEATGVTISLGDIVARAHELEALGDGVLVEGAGGLLAPYAPALTGADIAARLALPVFVVARDALGTINHTALTLAELRRRALSVAGIFLVATTPTAAPARSSNPRQIEIATGLQPIVVPYLADPTPAAIADVITGRLSRVLDAFASASVSPLLTPAPSPSE